jgi:hypothetical protein
MLFQPVEILLLPIAPLVSTSPHGFDNSENLTSAKIKRPNLTVVVASFSAPATWDDTRWLILCAPMVIRRCATLGHALGNVAAPLRRAPTQAMT